MDRKKTNKLLEGMRFPAWLIPKPKPSKQSKRLAYMQDVKARQAAKQPATV